MPNSVKSSLSKGAKQVIVEALLDKFEAQLRKSAPELFQPDEPTVRIVRIDGSIRYVKL